MLMRGSWFMDAGGNLYLVVGATNRKLKVWRYSWDGKLLEDNGELPKDREKYMIAFGTNAREAIQKCIERTVERVCESERSSPGDGVHGTDPEVH